MRAVNTVVADVLPASRTATVVTPGAAMGSPPLFDCYAIIEQGAPRSESGIGYKRISPS